MTIIGQQNKFSRLELVKKYDSGNISIGELHNVMELTTFILYGVDKSNLLAFFGPFKITHYHSYLTLEEGPTCSLLAHIFYTNQALRKRKNEVDMLKV